MYNVKIYGTISSNYVSCMLNVILLRGKQWKKVYVNWAKIHRV